MFTKHCGDVCKKIILMPQFLKEVGQHILDVVSIAIYRSVANLTDFFSSKRILKIG